MVTHIHHIVPRHAGGTNDPANLIELTLCEHTEAHRVLFEQNGRLQDKIARKMLAGKTDEGEQARIELFLENKAKAFAERGEEIQARAAESRRRTVNAPDYVSPLLGINLETAEGWHLERLQKQSEMAKSMQENGQISCIGDKVRGKRPSSEQRAKQSEKAKCRAKMNCPHCGKDIIPQMFSRWHGEKCSSIVLPT